MTASNSCCKAFSKTFLAMAFSAGVHLRSRIKVGLSFIAGVVIFVFSAEIVAQKTCRTGAFFLLSRELYGDLHVVSRATRKRGSGSTGELMEVGALGG